MTDASGLAAATLVAFVVTVVILSALRPIARAIKLVDRPGGRKDHVGEVPLVGGMAMFAGMFAAFTMLGDSGLSLLPIFVASAILVLVGAIDDRFHVPAPIRLMAQVAVVLLLVYGADLRVMGIGDPFGTGEILMGPYSIIVTMLVTISVINAYNLVDGVDGLAGTLALLATIGVAQIAGLAHPATASALAIGAAIIGFLAFNFPTPWNRKTRTFMGDAGSTLLGFTIVWITLGISQGADPLISPVHCLWFASIPIYDFFTCFVRRMLKGRSPFTPGRDHFHHTLRRGGFGVRSTLGFLSILQAVYVLVGVVGHETGVPDVVMFGLWSVVGLSQRHVIRLVAKHHRALMWRSQNTPFSGY